MPWWRGTIRKLAPDMVYVFGSNTEGRHGRGAALQAREQFGAIYGQSRGLMGQSYALVTKNLTPGHVETVRGEDRRYHYAGTRSVPLEEIKENVRDFYEVARQHPDRRFIVVYQLRSENLNGYTGEEMWDCFQVEAPPENVYFHESFKALTHE